MDPMANEHHGMHPRQPPTTSSLASGPDPRAFAGGNCLTMRHSWQPSDEPVNTH
jgi:hypothetical protein